MTDIAIQWDVNTASGDFAFVDGDLEADADLETAVLVSLFSDRVASADYKPTDGTDDRRGWWADVYETSPIGSRLWQLDRAKISSGTSILLKARDYCNEALQWMIDDGVASSVATKTWWASSTMLGIIVTITEPRQSVAKTFRYSYSWAQLQKSSPAPLRSFALAAPVGVGGSGGTITPPTGQVNFAVASAALPLTISASIVEHAAFDASAALSLGATSVITTAGTAFGSARLSIRANGLAYVGNGTAAGSIRMIVSANGSMTQASPLGGQLDQTFVLDYSELAATEQFVLGRSLLASPDVI